MTLSDDAYKRFVNKHYNKEWLAEGEVAHEQPKPIKGSFVYVPHDCDLPDPWETATGSIWACYGYRRGGMCYDQWILTIERGAKHWVLYKRNIRA